MQWQKAKTILIIVFFLINVFLLSYLFYHNHSNDQRKLQDLTRILSRNGIHLRLEQLPGAESSVFVPEFFRPVLNEKTAQKLIDNPVKTPEGGYTNQEKTCVMEYRNNLFHFENQLPKDKHFKRVNVKNVVSKLKPYLKALQVEELVYPIDIVELDGEIAVKYAYRVEERKLFGSSLTFTVTTEGIRQIQGFLGIPDPKNGFSYQLSQMETILLSLGQLGKKQLEISDIEAGYYFINYTDALISQAIPVYRIATTQGEILLDARDGVALSERELSQIMQ